jgi:hypothetical protein
MLIGAVMVQKSLGRRLSCCCSKKVRISDERFESYVIMIGIFKLRISQTV